MKNSKHPSIVHLWSDFYINADGNPQHYLKTHGYESNILAANIITDKKDLPANVFAFNVIQNGSNASGSVFSRAKKRLLRPFFWKKVNRWVDKHVETIKPDILHVHFGYTAVNMLPAIKKSKLPVIVTFYGVDGSSMIADAKWVKKYINAFKYVSYMVVLSETVRDRLASLGFDKEKIILWNIPIKLDTYKFREKQRTPAIKFITAARFVEKKGYPFLIAAFKKVNDLYPDTTLSIVGYGPGKSQIETEVARYGLETKVSIIDTKMRTDFHPFYYKHLCEHDIFVLPSTTSKNGDDEGGPSLTLVAAQAAGLPVICTPFVGSEITVFDNVTGVYCKQDDPDSIAEKMIFLMDNPSFCNDIGKAASELVHSVFLEKTQMNIILTLYNDIVK